MNAVYEEPRFSAEFFFLFLFFILLLSGAAFTMLLIMPLSKKHQKLAQHLREEEKEAREMQVMNAEGKDTPEEVRMVEAPSQRRFVWLLLLNTWMCAVFYGISPALLPYACLPYSNLTYSLAMRLSALSIPIASLISFWLKTSSIKVISGVTLLGTLLCIYPLYLATQSPDLPLADSHAGPALVVIDLIFLQ